jgi:hypothetical protein
MNPPSVEHFTHFIAIGRLIPLGPVAPSNALVQLQAQYNPCGEAASESACQLQRSLGGGARLVNGLVVAEGRQRRSSVLIGNDVHVVEHAAFPFWGSRFHTERCRKLRYFIVVPTDKDGLPRVRRVRKNQLGQRGVIFTEKACLHRQFESPRQWCDGFLGTLSVIVFRGLRGEHRHRQTKSRHHRICHDERHEPLGALDARGRQMGVFRIRGLLGVSEQDDLRWLRHRRMSGRRHQESREQDGRAFGPSHLVHFCERLLDSTTSVLRRKVGEGIPVL